MAPNGNDAFETTNWKKSLGFNIQICNTYMDMHFAYNQVSTDKQMI